MGIVLLHCAAGVLLIGGFFAWSVAKSPVPASQAALPSLVLIGLASVTVALAWCGAWLVKSARAKPPANPHKFTLREAELILCASYPPGVSKLLTLMDQAGHLATYILEQAYHRASERQILRWSVKFQNDLDLKLTAKISEEFLREAIREAIKLYAAI